MFYNDKLRLPDLMRQGFMKPRAVKRVAAEKPIVRCYDCLNWHTQGKHTSPIEVRRQRRAERLAEERAKGVKLLVTPEGEASFETTLHVFLRDNREDEWVKAEVRKLRPGQSVQLGGGAQPGIVVKRLGGRR